MTELPNPLIIPIGMAIGILVAAPVGPVNVLCIQRAISRGMWGGIAAGLGAVLGDALIAFSAAMGVGAISGAITYHRDAIQIVGGIVLMIFGWRLFVALPPRAQSVEDSNGHGARNVLAYAWDIPKTFLLTVTNPGAVLGLFAIFGGISSFVEVKGPGDALLMVASVAAGSLAWWVGLSYMVGRLRNRLSLARLVQINRGAGVLLIAMGLLLAGEIALKAMGLISSIPQG